MSTDRSPQQANRQEVEHFLAIQSAMEKADRLPAAELRAVVDRIYARFDELQATTERATGEAYT